MEIQKMIDGYNQEKAILTDKICCDDIVKNYEYATRVAFVKDTKLRIKEIDTILSEIRSLLIKAK